MSLVPPRFPPYEKRRLRFLRLVEHGSWRLKEYAITYQRPAPRPELTAAAERMARSELDRLPAGDEHYGVGFLGVHDGRGSNFAFLGLWANENELQHIVHTGPGDRPGELRPVDPRRPDACVWDVRLLAAERDLWVRHVLANPKGPDLEGYLADHPDMEA